MKQTLGQQRVRVTFNPDENAMVRQLKQKSAELIDLIEEIKVKDPRLAALAQTNFEVGAMFAVKLATAPMPVAEGADTTF